MPSLLGPFVRCGFGATLLVLCLVLAGFTCTGELFKQASCLLTKLLINVCVWGEKCVLKRLQVRSCWLIVVFFVFHLNDVSPRLTEQVVGFIVPAVN